MLEKEADEAFFSEEEAQENMNNMSFSLFDSQMALPPENYSQKQWLSNENELNKQSDNNKIED